jgi:hypothetical protein
MKYQSFRPINCITCSTKLSKAFDFLPKKSGRHAGFLVTEAFEAAWKRVFGSDGFTPSAIRAAANRNDPRLEEVRRICTTPLVVGSFPRTERESLTREEPLGQRDAAQGHL